MKIRDQSGFFSALMFILLGLGFAWGALEYNFGSSVRPGPGYFPFGLGLLLAAVGVGILIQSLTVRTHDGGRIGAIAWKPMVLITCSNVAAGIALPLLGMLITLPLLVLTSALASDEFHLGEALLNAAILTIASWAVFSKGLGLVIPLLPALPG